VSLSLCEVANERERDRRGSIARRTDSGPAAAVAVVDRDGAPAAFSFIRPFWQVKVRAAPPSSAPVRWPAARSGSSLGGARCGFGERGSGRLASCGAVVLACAVRTRVRAGGVLCSNQEGGGRTLKHRGGGRPRCHSADGVGFSAARGAGAQAVLGRSARSSGVAAVLAFGGPCPASVSASASSSSEAELLPFLPRSSTAARPGYL
jgi:hypothetical protein